MQSFCFIGGIEVKPKEHNKLKFINEGSLEYGKWVSE